jgi:hypothetical protein
MTNQSDLRFQRINATLEELGTPQRALAQNIDTLITRQTTHTHNFDNLDEAMANLANAQAETKRIMNYLAMKSAETQRNFDALIQTWNEWIRNRGSRNGKPEPPPVRN